MTKSFWMEVRRSLITLGWALLKHDESHTLLSLLGLVEELPVVTDLRKCYTIGNVTFDLMLKTEEPEPSPSSKNKEVRACTLGLRISRSPQSLKK
jgi:hypothetical protein